MRMFLAILFFIPSMAFGMTLNPTGPESSAYLDSNPVEVTTTEDGWLEVASPLETCRVHEGEAGWNWGIAYIGDIGAGQSLATYLTACTEPITDWTVDGNWYVRTYEDEDFTTMLSEAVFCQGVSCGEPPPTPTGTTTVEELLTEIHHDALWFLWFVVFACAFLWFERYYKT